MIGVEFKNVTLVQRLKAWLGNPGRTFFTELHREHGDAFGVAVLKTPGSTIPHPVHLREGMQVRNWLRDQKECRDWDQHRLDNEWAKLVLKAIRPPTIFDRLRSKD